MIKIHATFWPDRRPSQLLLAILVLLNISCSSLSTGVVRLTNDSYKKAKLFSLTLNVVPEEPGPVGNDRTARLDFFRDESASSSVSILTLTLKVDDADQDIREEIYFKVDGSPHKLKLLNFAHTTVTQTYANAVNVYSGNIGPSSTIISVKSKVYKGRIEFTKELAAALANCRSVALRAYMGADALNLNFSAGETTAIRKFFAGTPDETVNN